MVQQALAAALPALAAAGSAAIGAGSSLAGSLRGQSHKEVSRPASMSVLPVLAQAPDMKRAKYISKQADKERLLAFISQPEILGLIMTLGGIYASQKITFSDNKAVNEGIQATATSASVLIGLGHAGVGDLTTAIIAGLAGITSMADLLDIDLPSLESFSIQNILPWSGFSTLLKGIGIDV